MDLVNNFETSLGRFCLRFGSDQPVRWCWFSQQTGQVTGKRGCLPCRQFHVKNRLLRSRWTGGRDIALRLSPMVFWCICCGYMQPALIQSTSHFRDGNPSPLISRASFDLGHSIHYGPAVSKQLDHNLAVFALLMAIRTHLDAARHRSLFGKTFRRRFAHSTVCQGINVNEDFLMYSSRAWGL